MDGTAIMLAVVSIFGANLFNIELSLFQYLILLLTIIFYSVAIAGIPKGSLAVLSLILTTSIGLSLEQSVTIIGIVMVVDHLLDMLRTAVNVTGDAAIACVIAKSENELNDKIFNDPNACCLIEPNLLKPKRK
jgi:Na+/H+-dicarboxylate symporter